MVSNPSIGTLIPAHRRGQPINFALIRKVTARRLLRLKRLAWVIRHG